MAEHAFCTSNVLYPGYGDINEGNGYHYCQIKGGSMIDRGPYQFRPFEEVNTVASCSLAAIFNRQHMSDYTLIECQHSRNCLAKV